MIFINRRIFIIFIFILIKLPLFSQQITISGKVVDKKGNPLIAATIAELNTNNGTFTEFDGRFTLTVSENSQIEISYFDCITQILSAKEISTLQIITLSSVKWPLVQKQNCFRGPHYCNNYSIIYLFNYPKYPLGFNFIFDQPYFYLLKKNIYSGIDILYQTDFHKQNNFQFEYYKKIKSFYIAGSYHYRNIENDNDFLNIIDYQIDLTKGFYFNKYKPYIGSILRKNSFTNQYKYAFLLGLNCRLFNSNTLNLSTNIFKNYFEYNILTTQRIYTSSLFDKSISIRIDYKKYNLYNEINFSLIYNFDGKRYFADSY